MNIFRSRAIGVAATCAAVAMAVGVASPALAATSDSADGQGMMILTPEQTDQLAAHAQVDVYGDAGSTPGDLAPTAPATDGGGNHLDAATWKLTARGAVEGDYGMVETAPVAGGGQDYFAIDSLGIVQRRTAAGAEVWRRTNQSWYQDWKVTPIRPWQTEPYPVRILTGYNAVSPFTPASEDGFATGDLNGDGVADLVFSASVGSNPFRPFSSPGSSLITGTFVTVVDGATGKTMWSKLYPAAFGITLIDHTLIVADSPYFNQNSAAVTTSTTLQATRFSYADGALTGTPAWTYDAGSYLATAWADLQPLGGGLLAASWDQRKTSPTAAPSGHTLVIDTADGSVKWSATNRLYSRQLRVDASRNRLVAIEQSDPNEGVQYQVVGYSLADGSRTVLDTRVNALPLASAVGDLGLGGASYVLSEATLDPNLYINASTVRTLDGSTGAQKWSRTLKRASANTHDGISGWGLQIVDGRVLVNYRDDAHQDTADNRGGSRYGRLSALAGNNGSVKWEQTGVAASQLWSQPYLDGTAWRVRTADTAENVRVYNLGSGKQTDVSPLLADSSSAVTVKAGGSTVLVTGGSSQGVFAWDGASLVAGSPKLLWRATAPGAVQSLITADVNGDGRDEVVVAADTGAAVIDAATGKVLTTIDGNGQFVRTVAAADVNGDGKAEIILSTDAVRAYTGAGKLLWSYNAPANAGDVVFGDVSIADGTVFAEYSTRGALAQTTSTADGVALDGKTGALRWTAGPQAPASLGFTGTVLAAPQRAATFASPGIPYADGHAVVMTWVARLANGSGWVFAEIRDGRTGEVLHTAKLGGVTATNNWFTGPEGLIAGTTAAFRVFGPNGADAVMNAAPTVWTGGFTTGPNGERILVAAVQGGVATFTPETLFGSGFPAGVATMTVMDGNEMLVADLNGDGRDEIISLGLNETGTDRAVALMGSAYSVPFTAMRQFVAMTVDAF